MRFVSSFLTLLAAASTTTAAACTSDATLPSDAGAGDAEASAVIAVDSALADGGATRIEINLFPGELVAREVHVENDDAEEKLVSQVTGIDPAQGTVTLALGGLTVRYGDGTRFRTDSESHEARGTWEALVQSELAAGRHPLVEARRDRVGAAQAPDDPSFTATDLRLEDEVDQPKIEIYVDGDNLVSVDGTSEAVLRVLGLSIIVNGRTSLGPDDNGGDDDGGDDDGSDDDGSGDDGGDDSGSGGNGGGPGSGGTVEFEMGVASVDASAGTLTLSNETVVRVGPQTAVSPEGDVVTLGGAASAVAQGRPVRAEGRGQVESAGPPPVIAASTIKIEVDD